jgi:hypothetical protein
MPKTLNQIFFLLHQHQNICFSNIGNQNIFLEKNHKPPLQVKWSFPKKALESWQYRAAKLILRTKMDIPRSALLLELGWEPITTFIDRSKVSYFKRLSELPDSRLCKQVYNKNDYAK